METILAAPLGAIALLAREAFRAGAPRAVCDTASVCDSVFSIPGTALASAGLAALAGWIYGSNA